MATASKTVPREFYDDAVRQRDLALARAAVAEDRLAVVVKELADLKRHDVAAPARSHIDPERLNPEYGLGGHTLLAIDEVAGHDVQLRAQQLTHAHAVTAQAKAEGLTGDELDRYVAHIITVGDG